MDKNDIMAKWFFPPVAHFRVQGRGIAEDNFAAEDRKSEEIMGREVFQNPLDARSNENQGPIRVSLKILDSNQFNVEYLRSLLPVEFGLRLDEASGIAPELDFSKARVLVIEDFGTTGLNGCYTDSTVDGKRENWNAFWFREGEGAKDGPGSNGRAGQGKITFYRTSRARALFGFTVRESDRKSLLMGRASFLRTYPFGNQKFERDSFWCVEQDNQVLPIENKHELNSFREAFALERCNKPGLSLVIPFPGPLDAEELLRTAISDFYLPIARGRLEVQVADEVITKENIDDKADNLWSDALARERKSSLTKGFRSMVQGVLADKQTEKTRVELTIGWEKSATLKEAHFPTGSVEQLRTALDHGERIWVRCPVVVRPAAKDPVQTYFDVHLEMPEDLDRVEEAYVRRDLLIGSESHLASSSYLPNARGLTLIEDDGMSAFLADAEEPTHLKWNASRPRLAEDYKSPKELVRAVRLALPRILTLLAGGEVARDVKVLSKYFAKPAQSSSKRTPGGANNNGGGTAPNPAPPPPRRKLFSLDTGVDWVAVRPSGSVGPIRSQLPIQCELEVAYEGLDSDPFDAFDPFDFDLMDEDTHEIEATGATILSRDANKVEFEVKEPDFKLRVGGFDSKIRLRARLTYKEDSNGKNIDAE